MMVQRLCCNRRDVLEISVGTAGAMVGFPASVLVRATRGSQDEKSTPPAAAPAKAEDVGSIDAIVKTLYAAISGPPGRREFDRLRSLFHSGARLIPCFITPEDQSKGTTSMRILTIDEFVAAATRSVKTEGFYEREIARRVERFGAVAHVFSTYESRRGENDPQPFVRGINSIQLFFDGRRWWIVTILWDSERPDRVIPDEFLPKRAAR
jgi:hypothetical protein